MSRRALFSSTMVLLGMIGIATAFAMGMRVQPGGALIQGWPFGERRELPAPLVIFNDDDEAHLVHVSTCKPSAIGARPPRGYREIPDPGWLTFSLDKVEIRPRSLATVKMFLSVPPEEVHFSIRCSVSSL